MSTVAKYNLYLDSKYRTAGGNPTPSFSLQTPILLSNPNHRFICSVRSVDIPYSFKQLAVPYNVLRVEYVEVGSLMFFVTIAEGNYAITVLCQTLINLIQTAITGFAVNPPLITSSYNQYEGKVTFTIQQVSGATPTSVKFFWTDPNLDILSEFFGFDGSLDTTLSYNGGGTPAYINNVSQIHVNVSPMSSIYLRSTTLTQSAANEEILTEYASSVSDILLKVPVLTTYNSWLMYENTTVEVDLNNKSIDVIDLYLTGTTYNPVVLFGVHWRVHMEIREVRDEWIDRMVEDQKAKEQVLQALEQQRFLAMSRLQSVRKDLRERIPLLLEEQGQTQGQGQAKQGQEQDALQAEQELMAEIQKNRELS